jgi:UDP-3-O-[3-hydroxymyristoyl] glucosamine N-acyltransferase
MQFTAKDIAFMLNGTVEGDPLAMVNHLAKIEEGAIGSLSFLANPKYEQYIVYNKCVCRYCNNSLELNRARKSNTYKG